MYIIKYKKYNLQIIANSLIILKRLDGVKIN